MASAVALLVALACGACGTTVNRVQSCAAVDAGCVPAYEPTFDKVFENTLKARCGIGGGACHTARGHQGNIVLDDRDQAYETLHAEGVLGNGQLGCSDVAVRITSTNGNNRMPPGGNMPEGEQCAIIQWIAAGAKK